jgi:hypothetical protein
VALILPFLRDYLVAEGIVRVPSVSGSAPPIWLEPRLGTPAPGEGNNPTERGATVVVGAVLEPGISPDSYESFKVHEIAAFTIRTLKAPDAHAFGAQLRAALIDKRNWDMAGMRVIESQEWSGIGLIVSDAQAYTYRVAYWFERYFPGPGPN